MFAEAGPWVAITVAAIGAAGTVITAAIAFFLKRFDARNTEQHAENGQLLSSILKSTQDNHRAIGEVQVTLSEHLTFHVAHPSTHPESSLS